MRYAARCYMLYVGYGFLPCLWRLLETLHKARAEGLAMSGLAMSQSFEEKEGLSGPPPLWLWPPADS